MVLFFFFVVVGGGVRKGVWVVGGGGLGRVFGSFELWGVFCLQVHVLQVSLVGGLGLRISELNQNTFRVRQAIQKL